MSSKAKDTGFLRNLVIYDVSGNITLPADLSIFGNKQVATKEYVDGKVTALINSAPAILDTLGELATAIGNDANFISNISTSIGTKVSKSTTLTINGVSYDLTDNRSWTINSMVYPTTGIALSNGTGWDGSIANNSANWNTAYGWGNHALVGYLTSFTETDPTVGTHIKAITTTSISHWDSAYSWGNHSIVGYESASNKSNNALLGTSTTLYPTQAAVKSYVDSAVTGGMNIQGDWNASTNTPNISTTTTTGFTWRVSVAGTTNIGGITTWNVNDLVVKTASGWIKIDNSSTVQSVFGRQGIVVANSGDYNTSQVTENGNLYFTTARARAAFSAGTNISIDANGVIASTYTYSLPTATASVLGGVKIGAGITITTGVISVSTNYEAPIATGTTAQYWRGDKTWQTLPVYSVGDGGLTAINFTVARRDKLDGIEAGANAYTLPTASSTVLGGVKIGSGITITTGTISVSTNYEAPITAGTTSQYWRGDKTWQTLNSSSVGLGNVSNAAQVTTTYNSSLNGDSRNSRGVTRLYRRDDDSDYSVQTYWTGSYWRLYGYNGDNAHADVQVGYSDSAGYATNGRYSYDNGANGGSVQWKEPSQLYVYYARFAGSIEWSQVVYRPTNLSQFTNDLGNYGGWLSASGGTISGNLTINGSTNTPLTLNATEPYLNIVAAGASNTAGIAIYPTYGYDAAIGNFNAGALNLMASSSRIGQMRIDGSYYDLRMGQGTPSQQGSISFYSSTYGSGYEGRIASNNSDGNTHFYSRNNSSSFTDVGFWSSSGLYAIAFYESSDVRFKNILEINPSIDLMGLDVIKFTRTDSNTNQIRYGYSAQQLKNILPDVVMEGEKLTVNYMDVHTLKIASLERRIKQLEERLKSTL